jgi:hypothetical protein
MTHSLRVVTSCIHVLARIHSVLRAISRSVGDTFLKNRWCPDNRSESTRSAGCAFLAGEFAGEFAAVRTFLLCDEWLDKGGSDSVYSFFDVSGFKAGFGRKLFTDIDTYTVGYKFGYPTQKRPPEPPPIESLHDKGSPK